MIPNRWEKQEKNFGELAVCGGNADKIRVLGKKSANPVWGVGGGKREKKIQTWEMTENCVGTYSAGWGSRYNGERKKQTEERLRLSTKEKLKKKGGGQS